jgi:hypothetical protein
MEFHISERFRLEIHWSKVKYEKEGIAQFEGCYLSGPVLNEVAQMSEQDTIVLNFSEQYKILLNYYYVAKFSWRGIKQSNEKIYLSNVILSNRYINSVPQLKDDDYIVVDTQDHEDYKHQLNFTYKSYLIKSDNEVYNFGDN